MKRPNVQLEAKKYSKLVIRLEGHWIVKCWPQTDGVGMTTVNAEEIRKCQLSMRKVKMTGL